MNGSSPLVMDSQWVFLCCVEYLYPRPWSNLDQGCHSPTAFSGVLSCCRDSRFLKTQVGTPVPSLTSFISIHWADFTLSTTHKHIPKGAGNLPQRPPHTFIHAIQKSYCNNPNLQLAIAFIIICCPLSQASLAFIQNRDINCRQGHATLPLPG